MTKQELALKLFEIGAIKFGAFTLVSGVVSPIYLDLKMSISYPEIMKEISEFMYKEIEHVPYDLICGVPYTALPFATVISVLHNKPMVIRRKEKKDYGLKKLLEGKYEPGQNVLVIEDLVTSGTSVFETIAPLEEAGLKVTDIVVLVDREQGGKANLTEKGYTLHAVMPISEILLSLKDAGKVDEETFHSVKQFLAQNQVKPVQR